MFPQLLGSQDGMALVLRMKGCHALLAGRRGGGVGGVERCSWRPGPCLSGSGGWPSTDHGPGLLGPGPGGPV